MHRVHWLARLAPLPRWLLIGASTVGLMWGTGLADGAAAWTLAALVGLAWGWGGWQALRTPTPASPHPPRDRGMLAREAMEALRTPDADISFSLPGFLARAKELIGLRLGEEPLIGPARVTHTQHQGPALTCLSRCTSTRGCRRPDCSRDPMAPGRSITWRRSREVAPTPSAPTWSPIPMCRPTSAACSHATRRLAWLGSRPSSRRCTRHSTQPGATTIDLAPYCTPTGLTELRWWRAWGLPNAEGELQWLEVQQDGQYERMEVQRGARVLGLLRAAGHPEAPWQVWRLRSAA